MSQLRQRQQVYEESYFALSCRVSDVQLTRRSYPLIAARGLLRQFIQEHRDGHQAS